MALLAVSVLPAAMPLSASAQQPVTQTATVSDTTVCGLPLADIAVKRNGELVSLAMNMNLSGFEMHGDRVAVFAPVLINGADSLAFDPVGLYSRMRYLQYLRSGERALGGENESSYRYGNRPDTEAYAQIVPYADWMNGATLYMRRSDYGCCRTLLDEQYVPLMAWADLYPALMDHLPPATGWRGTGYTPAFRYVTPRVEKVKERELAGRAYIDFPVNRTELYPDYRKNPTELAKIIATIDSVRNDEDVTVRRITIKGWASPESPWSNNTRLAKGRTATLKQYVQNLYHFPEGFIETDYYPEDWIGLRDFVDKSNLPHRKEILALIDDTTIEPDPKEDKLKKTYPEEYKFLLATVYPGLRHSDYTIEYTIRHFSDPVEIARIMKTAPQKLSLEEMFVLAQTLEAGSSEFNEVFETAVRMYPNDETANLNAAISAMQRDDFANAEKYLLKAGNSDAAVYARGVYAMLTDNVDRAEVLFRSVVDRMPEAVDALKAINDFRKGK